MHTNSCKVNEEAIMRDIYHSSHEMQRDMRDYFKNVVQAKDSHACISF